MRSSSCRRRSPASRKGSESDRDLAEPALSELGAAVQGLAAEARLLAQPVSFELASTTQHEGIEDRTTMAPLGARRLAEMVELGARVVAVELTIAAQAIDLRERPALGAGTGSRLRARPGASAVHRRGRDGARPTSSLSWSWFGRV